MKKKVLISYIWDDRSDEKWLFWLKKQLESKNFEVTFSELKKDVFKRTDQATWIASLQNIHGVKGENTHFVSHDPGCLTILNYLEYLDKHNKTDPTLLVAGFPKKSALVNNTLKRLAGSTSPVIMSGSQELELTALSVKLIVLYGGIIEEVVPLKLGSAHAHTTPQVSGKKGIMGYLKDKFGK